MDDRVTSHVSTPREPEGLPAGDFSSWLRQTREALLTDADTDVDCRDCTGCCTSSQFIHIRPDETDSLAHIPRKLLFPAPGLPAGHLLMGYDKRGLCPMLIEGKCSIYAHRPQTCRSYDCRVFTAAGLTPGGNDKARITERVQRWRFSFPTRRDHDEFAAVQAAARFIREHASSFPGGRAPGNPSQVAIVALKSYEVFLEPAEGGETRPARSNTQLADAIVEACRNFDASFAGIREIRG